MKKIPTMFERDEKTHRVFNQIKPECGWVLAGEGVATRKWDGTCCMFKGGKLFKRYDGSRSKHIPGDFIPADGAESHWLGWRPVGDGPEDMWFVEAFKNLPAPLPDGTYELVGPRVNKNPEAEAQHCFRKHGDWLYSDTPRDFDGLREWLTGKDIEGIVFHHPDGRMAKIKLKDFGIRRVPAPSAPGEGSRAQEERA